MISLLHKNPDRTLVGVLLGNGAKICDRAAIGNDVSIGRNAVIGNGVVIGDHTSICGPQCHDRRRRDRQWRLDRP